MNVVMPEDIYFLIDYEYDRKKLSEIVYNLDACNSWDSYIPPSWDESKYTIDNFTGQTYRYYEDLQDIEPIAKIRNDINLSYLDYKHTQLLKFPPENGPTIHRDIERQTAILFPIFTFEIYEPIKFYKDNTIEEWFEVDYKNKVIVFDAKKLHAVENKQYNRYSLQFDIEEDFLEIKRKHIRGEFIKC